MSPIKKILFPVDFSPSCFSAARYVEAMAGHFEAEIMLVHVVGRGDDVLAEELLPLRRAQLNTFLADELKYFSTQRICVTGEDPAAEIEAAARRWDPDLAMMPTHGLGFFQRHFPGSVTARLLKDLECPLWTSVHAETPVPLEQIHLRKILCAVDFSERSQMVLNWAASLAKEYEAELGIVHATAAMPALVAVGLAEDLGRSVSARAREEVQTLQATAGTSARVFIDGGDAAAVVAGSARDFDADLLVTGRHIQGGAWETNDAFAILRESPCPVISV